MNADPQTIARAALSLWGMEGARVTLIARRENAVFRAQHGARVVALRLHRPGYRSDAELASELHWMDHVARAGIDVPRPLPGLDGALLYHVEGTQIDALAWVEGETLDACLPALAAPDAAALFAKLGACMARLHKASDSWTPPAGFTRCSWDRTGLLGAGPVGVAPLWDRFWDNPGLSAADRALFLAFRDRAASALDALDPELDKGLIHADLVAGNVMVCQTDSGPALTLIDFDDGGFGYRLFDVATALFKHRERPDYATLHDALIAGYRTQRALDTAHLSLFMALRAVTYVGWNIARAAEDPTGTRNTRFIEQARTPVQAWLDSAA